MELNRSEQPTYVTLIAVAVTVAVTVAVVVFDLNMDLKDAIWTRGLVKARPLLAKVPATFEFLPVINLSFSVGVALSDLLRNTFIAV